MPATGMRQEFELETRDRWTKVNVELGMKVNGRELPNMAILGAAMEKAIELIRDEVKKAYTVVPARPVDTPVAQPYQGAKV